MDRNKYEQLFFLSAIATNEASITKRNASYRAFRFKTTVSSLGVSEAFDDLTYLIVTPISLCAGDLRSADIERTPASTKRVPKLSGHVE